MDKEIAISVEHVYKRFKLPHEKITSIKTLFTQGFKRQKGYEVQHALEDISLEVKRGEFFGIVGRNGSGKSTLLKMLAGIYQPTRGKISVNGKLVPFIELGVGFNPELTGRENVYLNGALLGFTKKQIDEMYDDIVEFAELERFMDQKLKNYSSGMQVRLAFSVATRSEADILLVDEVLAVGDADFQKKCYEYFKSLKNTNTTVVFVTHDMSAVREYCDRAILIERGSITCHGRVEKVADEYHKLFLPPGERNQSNNADQERFGTGEVVFSGISYLYNDNLSLEFDIENTTSILKEGIAIGFDFYSNGELITGNGTKYIDAYKKGLTLKPNETKRLSVEFPNYFGNFSYDLNMNIRTENGLNICDEIKPAISFQSSNTHMARFFKVTLPVKIKELR